MTKSNIQPFKVLHLIDKQHQLMCLVTQDGGIVSYFYEDHPVTEYYGQHIHKDNLELLDELVEDQFDLGALGGVQIKDWDTNPTPKKWLTDALSGISTTLGKTLNITTVHLVEGDTEYGLTSEWLEDHFQESPSVSYIPNHKLPWQIRTSLPSVGT